MNKLKRFVMKVKSNKMASLISVLTPKIWYTYQWQLQLSSIEVLPCTLEVKNFIKNW
jgi:hypothetical protein